MFSVKNLCVAVAFLLGCATVAWADDAWSVLRRWQYTNALCCEAESLWRDVNGDTIASLRDRLDDLRRQRADAEATASRFQQALMLAQEELGSADAHIAGLANDLAHSERVRDTQAQELDKYRELLAKQESLVHETNWRYRHLVSRLRQLGYDSTGELAAE
jgi:chromosome segregation ATPase